MIDTHTHIDGEEFESDRDDIIARAKSAGVSHILLPNIDMMSLLAMDEACNMYPDICRPLYGLHPSNVTEDYKIQLEAIFAAAAVDKRIVGIGEIGLDLHWDDKFRAEQIDAFEWQINYAIEHNLPMSIHVRDAFADMYDVFSKFDGKKLVGSLHCFSGNAEDAKRCVEQYPNLMFGINGTFTYKKSELPEIYKTHIPLDRILLETDAPYLAPQPLRGKRNEPSNLPVIIKHIAEAYGVSVKDIENYTDNNAKRLFRNI
ncbi:MAG: TatD family hydrolase [Bacteroidales bacterium]|nr:TatD family hydrolase [Bacteroidales bacterium]